LSFFVDFCSFLRKKDENSLKIAFQVRFSMILHHGIGSSSFSDVEGSFFSGKIREKE